MNLSTARTDLAPAVLTVLVYGSTPRHQLSPLATKSSRPLRLGVDQNVKE